MALLVLATIALDYRAPYRTEGEPRWGPAGAERTAIVPTHRLGHWYVPIACRRLT